MAKNYITSTKDSLKMSSSIRTGILKKEESQNATIYDSDRCNPQRVSKALVPCIKLLVAR